MDMGYGHHSYQGYGVDENGNYVICFSSGCSCNGSCGVDHIPSFKTLTMKDNTLFEDVNPEDIDFHSLQVSFMDY